MVPFSAWAAFHVALFGFLSLDLGVFHRKNEPVGLRSAALWSCFWVLLALAFAAGVNYTLGPQRGLEFLTGYLIERALSLDNTFVFAVVFSFFAVPAGLQHRVLFWGILGALIFRGAFIAAGVTLLEHFSWLNLVFGAFVLITGVRFFFHRPENIRVERNPLLRLARRMLPVTAEYHGSQFIVRSEPGGWAVTPLLLVLLVVESADVAFALDSIPAIFSVTRDPFIVYTSNVFAILGLRASYFLIAALLARLRFINIGLSALLVFIGLKMLAEPWYRLSIGASLLIVLLLLVGMVAASLLAPGNPVSSRDTPGSAMREP
jgi:tellurite resistance protein TerC